MSNDKLEGLDLKQNQLNENNSPNHLQKVKQLWVRNLLKILWLENIKNLQNGLKILITIVKSIL